MSTEGRWILNLIELCRHLGSGTLSMYGAAGGAEIRGTSNSIAIMWKESIPSRTDVPIEFLRCIDVEPADCGRRLDGGTKIRGER